MGKGDTRKKQDQPQIRLSNSTVATLPGGKRIVAEQCPVSFQTQVTKSALTVTKVPVTLISTENAFHMFIGGSFIGKLNRTHSRIIKECGELGLHYKGEIFIENDKTYVRFRRSH